jgi:hypothetical protein
MSPCIACDIRLQRDFLRGPTKAMMVRQKGTLKLARFGEFDLDPQFDLGQNRVEAGVAG